ncbi:carbohydrate ABC transporter permease [Actinotalea fermentans]|uniref:Sugar ABC transporter permease n=1 Tax=Actinotalea fermentans TaxID=43671 RepID=A0A511Z2D9_9CELL|nr:sugar ABC transporter permease [Actinotalea fermentans]GEN81618.1 sugar ABC transporter permease [Actinotalea fermentans]
MLTPAIVLLAWWFVTPIVQSVVLSFQQVSKFRFDERTFVGLQNYSELFADDAFRRSLGITATFVLFVVPAQTVLAILVAATLQGVARGRTLFRTVFFVPYMTSTVAITTIFMQLFVKGGPVSSTLARFGTPDVTWYADTGMALIFLVIVYVYMFVGLYIVIFVGGMESIPASLYEAATMDGAGVVRRFWHVTLPGLRPYAVFVVVAGVIQAIQVFDQAYVISGGTVLGSPAGATSTIVVFIYQQAFRLNAIGYGSAATVVLLATVIIAGVISRRIAPKEA